MNEEGSEVQAATALKMNFKMLTLAFPFVVDHPFLFAIFTESDNSRQPLFYGCVVN